ncbi:class I SAM-dependent methyltransferase [Pollutibacter soli]|uniref:class I SAM-dependent methyltransferase n=1 Tax=Pollutibacter soli TaxID=3034157 RepID=UPI0030135E19
MLEKLTLVEGGIHRYGNIPDGSSYDTKARLYEFLVSTTWYNKLAWGTSPCDYARFAKQAVEKAEGKIIDVGCGGLTHTARFYSSFKQDLILVDNSKEMLQIARKRMLKNTGIHRSNVSYVLADLFNLPFRESFDTLLSFGMLHLFDNKEHYLDCIFKTLKPGGKFFISALTTDRKFSRKYIAFLQKNKEIGIGMSSSAIVAMVNRFASQLDAYTVGSMVFLHGKK